MSFPLSKLRAVFGRTYLELVAMTPRQFADAYGEKFATMSVSKIRKYIKRESKKYRKYGSATEIVISRAKVYKHLSNARGRCSESFKNHRTAKYYLGKGVKCHLTFDDVLYLYIRDHAYLLRRPSIDRLDSSKDYELSNCRFIEQATNSRLRKH